MQLTEVRSVPLGKSAKPIITHKKKRKKNDSNSNTSNNNNNIN